MNYLVYQAYGKQEILDMAVYSLLSFLKTKQPSTAVEIVIYTDQPAYFAPYFKPGEIRFEALNPLLIAEWKGPDDFVHRLKIKMLQHFAEKYQGNILYLDTDTCLENDISPLFAAIDAGTLFMHEEEGKLDTKKNPVFTKLYRFLEKNNPLLLAEKGFEIPVTTDMWNAGVLGFRSADKHLLEQVLYLSDTLYALYKKHVMEQLAFSYVFRHAGRMLQPADGYIFHYWNYKEFGAVLNNFFREQKNSSREAMLQKLDSIAPRHMVRTGKRSFLQKLLFRAHLRKQ